MIDLNPLDFIQEIVKQIINSLKDLFLNTLNSPIAPLLNLIKELLNLQVNLNLFIDVWQIIVYLISLFYGLIFLYSGFNFIISSYDVVKREQSKTWIKNSVLMIIFVNSSFIIYKTLIDISSLLTSNTLSLINDKIFTAELNFTDFGFQVIYLIFFLAISLFTLLLLGIRYFFASFGLVLFPLALVFYFIPYTKPYGKFILELLLISIFLPFIHALLILGTSKLLEIEFFSKFKLLALTIGFSIVNLTILLVFVFVFLKVISSLISDINIVYRKV